MRVLFALLALALASASQASTLYLTIFKDRPPVTYQAAYTPALSDGTLTFTNAASVQSAAFPYLGTLVRIQCDAPCHVVVGGANPTALATSMRLTTGQTEYFTVTAGDKLAVIGE